MTAHTPDIMEAALLSCLEATAGAIHAIDRTQAVVALVIEALKPLVDEGG